MSDTDLLQVADVEAALLRSLRPDETTYMPVLIRRVSSMLRDKRATIDDRIAGWTAEPRPADAIDPVIVAGVLADVIARRLNNPKGLWSTSETEGEYSYSETYPGQRSGSNMGAPGDLELTAADLAKIDRVATRARSISTSCLPYTTVPRWI